MCLTPSSLYISSACSLNGSPSAQRWYFALQAWRGDTQVYNPSTISFFCKHSFPKSDKCYVQKYLLKTLTVESVLHRYKRGHGITFWPASEGLKTNTEEYKVLLFTL